MQFYWVTLESGKCGTVHAETSEVAKTTAETIVSALTSEKQVAASAETLPYPARPIWFSGSGCPAFCYKPEKCKGNTSCPQRISCTEGEIMKEQEANNRCFRDALSALARCHKDMVEVLPSEESRARELLLLLCKEIVDEFNQDIQVLTKRQTRKRQAA